MRLFTQRAGSPDSPLVVVPSPPTSDSSRNNAPQSATQYTVGVTGTLDGGDRWLHSFVAGIDGYNLANVQTNFTPVPSVADSALRARLAARAPEITERFGMEQVLARWDDVFAGVRR